MTRIERFRRWVLHPSVRPWFAGAYWWMTVVNVLWTARDMQEHYFGRKEIQAARIRCEAEGGFYGAPIGAALDSERCFRSATETALADRRTR